MDWINSLNGIGQWLKGIAGGASDYDKAAEDAADVKTELAENLIFATRSEKRETLNLTHVANAANHLKRLPDCGESFHCIVKGNYPQWALVPATIRLAESSIDELYLVTLGFSKDNASELLELIDAKKIASASILCSCYFKAHDQAIYFPLLKGMTERNQRMIAMRTHAKIILIKFASGLCLTIEGSANLRSCRNIEQFVMVNDPCLYEFHKGWIETIFETNARASTNSDE